MFDSQPISEINICMSDHVENAYLCSMNAICESIWLWTKNNRGIISGGASILYMLLQMYILARKKRWKQECVYGELLDEFSMRDTLFQYKTARVP